MEGHESDLWSILRMGNRSRTLLPWPGLSVGRTQMLRDLREASFRVVERTWTLELV